MFTIDEVEIMLNEVAETLPKEWFRKLTGGINLSADAKLSPHAKGKDLYILGEYKRGSMLGRFIMIYYGSFIRVYGHLPEEEFKAKLEHTLCHELTHHIESLAGAKDLEIEDAKKLSQYLEGREKNSC